MKESSINKIPLVIRILLGFLYVLAGIAAGVVDFFVSTIIFDSDPFGFGFVDMLPAALIGFGIFLPVILIPFFLTRKRTGSFSVLYLISGLISIIIVLIYLGSIRFYY